MFNVQLDDSGGGFLNSYKFAEHFPFEGTGMGKCPHVRCVPILFQTINYPIRVPAELSCENGNPPWVPYEDGLPKASSSTSPIPLVWEDVRTLKISEMMGVSS